MAAAGSGGATIEFDVPATMRDGTILRANIFRPTTGGPWPTLLTRLPYDKNAVPGGLLDPLVAVRRGFMVVIQDTRGRFASEGDWAPMRYEQEDGYDTVRWAAALPGSNGSVGMFGGSYFGNTQWMAAIAKPPELKAIAPVITWSEPLDGMVARGGAAELGLMGSWPLLQGLSHLARLWASNPPELHARMRGLVGDIDALAERTYWELPATPFPAVERNGVPGAPMLADGMDETDFCRVAGRHDMVEVPSFNIGGWYDIFLQGTIDNHVAMTAAGRPSQLLLGPWSHPDFGGNQLGETNFGFAANALLVDLVEPLMKTQLDWFDRWLADPAQAAQTRLAAGQLDEATLHAAVAPVKIFVMGINQWRDEAEWPLSRAVDTDFHLGAGELLTRDRPGMSERPDWYVYDPADPVMTRGGALLMTGEFPAGVYDQAVTEQRADVLVFSTEPLPADLEVTGRVKVKLYASTSAPTTDWVARLCDVDADGVSRNITDGIVRVSGEPGEVVEHEIDLWSTSIVFRAGHRIRVQITSSNFPRWDRALNTDEPVDSGTELPKARQTVYHDASRPSRIVLPVVP